MDSVIVLSDSVVKDVSSDFFVQDVAVKAGDVQLGDMPSVVDTSDIEKFFSRPVRIASYTWNVGAVPFYQIDPWTAFITNARVAEKLAWFSRLRGKLVLRCNISATPYHYGLARFCYRAHPGAINTADPVYNFAVALESDVYTESIKVVSSQLPGVYINPGYITSAEISAPYVHFQPGIELQVLGCSSQIGTLMFIGFKALQTANGSNASATVDFYAHMEDVVLDVPTAMHQGFTMSDVRKVVSRTFTVAAKATALAGEWVPRVMSAAAMLGFSRPLSHDVPIGVRTQPFLLANYDAPDTCESLALSASTEQALGGQGLSVVGKDELVLEAIVSRPAYIAQSVWTSAAANSEFIFGAVVTPSISLVGNYVKPSIGNLYPSVKYALLTPQSFVASLGRFWKCTMVYKFTVVCSPFHQGRLRIWTDPRPFFDGNPVGINLVNSQVLNLAESHELLVEVPWQNPRDMLRTSDPFTNTYALTELSFIPIVTAFTTENCNGVVVAEVLSPLCSPSAGADVTVMVEVSARDMVLYSPVMPRSLPDGLGTIPGGLSWATDGTATPYTPF